MNSLMIKGVCGVRPLLLNMRLMSTDSIRSYLFETLAVSTPREAVFHVALNRPSNLNAMNNAFWREIGECFNQLSDDPECKAIVVSGNGKIFTAGIDLSDMGEIIGLVSGEEDISRKSRILHKMIKSYQDSFTSLEKCPKPVIVAVHSACVGGGVDLICSADIRYCTADSWFQVKEVDLGLAADVGTLQRLPKIIGNESLVRELCFSARKMFSNEAQQAGLVSRVFPDKESMISAALEMAALIANKSPVAVQETKKALVYSRDHSVQESLDYMAQVNSSALQSEDVRISAMAIMSRGKTKATYSKL